MNYKVGDIVKVRSDLSVDKQYDYFSVNIHMVELKGKVVRIAKKSKNSYLIYEDLGTWYWTGAMFESVTEEDVKEYLEEYVKDFKNYNIKFEIKKKEPILDEVEKKYLSDVIKPFRDRVKYIKKTDCTDNTTSFITIYMLHINKQENEVIYLPFFRTNTMYKGMIPHKEYSLEELGI